MIFFITNRKLCSNNNFLVRVRDAAVAGVDYILVREKDIKEKDFKNVVEEIIQMVTSCKTKVIIGHNNVIAEEFDNTFLHNSFSERDVNTFSVSTHSLEDIEAILKTSISYAFISHIFPTDCKKNIEPKGVKFVTNVLEKTKDYNIEVVALGGINKKTINLLEGTNLKHIGIMSEWQICDDVFGLVKYYRSLGY